MIEGKDYNKCVRCQRKFVLAFTEYRKPIDAEEGYWCISCWNYYTGNHNQSQPNDGESSTRIYFEWPQHLKKPHRKFGNLPESEFNDLDNST